MSTSISDHVRAQLNLVMHCPCCGKRRLLYREIAEQVNRLAGASTVSEDTIRRFASEKQPGNIRVKQLDAIDQWVRVQVDTGALDEDEGDGEANGNREGSSARSGG